MSDNYNDHIPVMLEEVLANCNLKSDSIVIDMTLGRAGHSKELLKKINKGHLYGIDQDDSALDYAPSVLDPINDNYSLIKSRFSNAIVALKEKFKLNSADFIFYDLGVSSPQFDDPDRGFSYRYDTRLDMRMDQECKLTAYDVVNKYSDKILLKALYEYADEKFARPIVKNIVQNREKKNIETTGELVSIIKESLPSKILHKDKHPAKKTFLAIRYLVNNEEEEIKNGIPKGIEFLSKNGRLAVLTFNSYEDGLVKQIFNSFTKPQYNEWDIIPQKVEINYRLITKKPLVPTEEEVTMNHRAKPAKLRIIERIG